MSSSELIAAVVNRPSSAVTAVMVDPIAEPRVTSEAQEGMRTFLDRRPPGWVEDNCS